MPQTDPRIRRALETLDPIRAEHSFVRNDEIEAALDHLKQSEGWTGAPRWVDSGDPGVTGTRSSPPRVRLHLGRWRLVSVATVMLSLALFALIALRPDGDPERERLDQAMASVAAVMATEPSVPLKAGEFRFLRTITAYRDTAVGRGGIAWMTTRPKLTERWIDRSGSGRERIAEGGQQFASTADKRAWRQAGAPNIGEIDGPLKTHVRELAASDARYALNIPLEEVPADPAALRSLVESTVQQANGSAPEATKAVELIGDLLRDPATSGGVRRAAYLALAEIDGVVYLGSRPDPLGRLGEAVGVTSGHSGGNTEYALVYSPSTGQPLAFTERLMASPKDSESEAYLGVEVYVAQGRTASSHELPDRIEALDSRRIAQLLDAILDGADLIEDAG